MRCVKGHTISLSTGQFSPGRDPCRVKTPLEYTAHCEKPVVKSKVWDVNMSILFRGDFTRCIIVMRCSAHCQL